ncbi:exodeoxyribonuclease VII small subunit [Desulfitispora alkaliphila]|uniref:exodeoxyribonuclease VII small subunit n=1 Tax=Desulfitispora alkaliphila TaxID=622674 RepID=UPI003D1CC887
MSKDKIETLEFEEALANLEKIVKQLETGELKLNESLDKFQQGIQLVKVCNEQLERAEKEIEMLVDNAGTLKAEKIDPEEFEVDEDEFR